MQETQSFRNHTRFDPPFHFFLVPVFLINVIFTIVVMVHHWPYLWGLHLWFVVLAVALLMLLGQCRRYANGVQDRVIRLEERIRYLQLLTPELVALSQALTIRQMIALRFASDAELPGLVERAVRENMEPKAIKQAITSWRGDYQRI